MSLARRYRGESPSENYPVSVVRKSDGTRPRREHTRSRDGRPRTHQATYTREDRCGERFQTQRLERRTAKMIKNYPEPSISAAGYRRLSLEDFERAGIRVAERRYGAEDVVFAPGDPDEHLYFVLSGTVRLYKLYGDYKEATVALLKDGDAFGELSLQEGSGQTLFAQALTDVRVAVMRKAVLVEVLKRDPELVVKLF